MLFKEDQNVSPSVLKPFARIQVKNSEFPSNPFFSLVCFAGSLNPFDFVNRRCDSSSRDRQWKNTCLLSSSYSQASAVTKCCKWGRKVETWRVCKKVTPFCSHIVPQCNTVSTSCRHGKCTCKQCWRALITGCGHLRWPGVNCLLPLYPCVFSLTQCSKNRGKPGFLGFMLNILMPWFDHAEFMKWALKYRRSHMVGTGMAD